MNKNIILTLFILIVLFAILLLITFFFSSKDGSKSPLPIIFISTTPTLTIFPTVEPTLIPPQQADKEQAEIERTFGKEASQTEKEYPWFYLMPIQAKKYFIYFDFEKKSFVAKLYPDKQSSVPVDQQIAQYKEEIRKILTDIDSSTQKYDILWEIN